MSDTHDAHDAPDAHDAHGTRDAQGTQDMHDTAGGKADERLYRLQRRLADFAAARDWAEYHTPKNLAVALSVEASELVEIFQWLTPEQSAKVMERPESAHRVADEVADVLAYLLQFCEVLGVDVLDALAAKIEKNELRFPPKGGSGPNRHSSE